jgi:hypothetical protein
MCLLGFIGQNSSWMCSLLYWELEICCLCICYHQQHPLCWLFQEEKRSCATVDICKALRQWTDAEEYCWKEPLNGIVRVCKFIVVDVSVFLGFSTALCTHLARDSWQEDVILLLLVNVPAMSAGMAFVYIHIRCFTQLRFWTTWILEFCKTCVGSDWWLCLLGFVQIKFSLAYVRCK